MPIYMDRHDIPGITLEDATKAHQQDLVHQHDFNCKAMTYWVDEERDNAFCLVEAPNIQAVKDLHNKAHGLMPHQIIEVDQSLVSAFLGRIRDPENDKTPIDSPFRILMVIETNNYINRINDEQYDLFAQKLHASIRNSVAKFDGKMVLLKSNSSLVSFKNIDNAVACAMNIKHTTKYVTPNFDPSYKKIQIGLSGGVPVTDKKHLFEDAYNLATYLCEIVDGDIVVSSEIKALYQSAHKHAKLDTDTIRILKPREETFLKRLMLYVEKNWNDTKFNVTTFSTEMGYSKSQLNRTIKSITGFSPNNFVRNLRLERALKMLFEQQGNISEIAFETGFNTPAYFSKCFLDRFGILPSTYIQQHTN